MRGYLRGLGAALFVIGVTVCVVAAGKAIGDDTFFRAGEALERHPDHILYQAEYQAALARHVAYIVTAILSGLIGVIGSAGLLGLSAVLRKLDDLRAAGR